MLLDDWLDDGQGLERAVLEVPLAVHAAHDAHRVAEAALLRVRFECGGRVFSGEEAARDGVVDDDVEAVAAARGDEFCFDGAGCVERVNTSTIVLIFLSPGEISGPRMGERKNSLMALYIPW